MTKKLSFISVLFIFVFALVVPAQFSKLGPDPADFAQIPFDFTKAFYYGNGVEMGMVFDRRTGADKYSVFGKSYDPTRSDIRVLLTVAAYSQKGSMLYWYPLGEFNDNAFRSDKIGNVARKTASLFPIYVFPVTKQWDHFTFATGRQAAVIDETRASTTSIRNPLGLRQIVMVNYTEKAFSPDYEGLMNYYAKHNGWSSEDTPILNKVADITYMFDQGLVTLDTVPVNVKNEHGQYMIAPIISDPTNGVIAKDAFIWMVEVNGHCLTFEEKFEDNFNCLLNGGKWCISSTDE